MCICFCIIKRDMCRWKRKIKYSFAINRTPFLSPELFRRNAICKNDTRTACAQVLSAMTWKCGKYWNCSSLKCIMWFCTSQLCIVHSALMIRNTIWMMKLNEQSNNNNNTLWVYPTHFSPINILQPTPERMQMKRNSHRVLADHCVTSRIYRRLT